MPQRRMDAPTEPTARPPRGPALRRGVALSRGTIPRLTPRRITAGVRRRAFTALTRLHPSTEAPANLVFCGTEYGGWTVPLASITDEWLCVCAGAGADVSFEAELLARTPARVVSVDPFETFARRARAELGEPGRYAFRVGALAARDGRITMTGRQDEERGSVSAHGLHPGSAFDVEAVSLQTLLEEQSAPAMQLLKLDIEGSEYDVLREADLGALGVRVLCVELHHTAGLRAGRALLRRLESQGMHVVHRRGTDFTLVRR